MTIEKLERVMWLIGERHTDERYITNKELKLCIMQEIGTDLRTYKANRKALITLGWLKGKGSKRVEITNKHITG